MDFNKKDYVIAESLAQARQNYTEFFNDYMELMDGNLLHACLLDKICELYYKFRQEEETARQSGMLLGKALDMVFLGGCHE